MRREITVAEIKKTLDEDEINDTIVVKRENKSDVVIMNINDYKRVIESKFISRLKKGEEQIKKGEVTDGDIVFKRMRKKYGYKWRTVQYTNDAINEMENVFNYISEKLYAPKATKDLMLEIDENINNLKYMPRKYRTIKKYDELDLEYRRMIIKKYCIIYTINYIFYIISFKNIFNHNI